MSKTCCVTGHRDLPAGRLPEITAALSAEIDRAIAEGFDSFFSGFAEGVDADGREVDGVTCADIARAVRKTKGEE